MSVVSLDALAQRRALKDKTDALESAKHRVRRAEGALRSLRDILSTLPDPVEVIGEDLLIHFANRSSQERHGGALEGKPYYSALFDHDTPPENSPVLVALRENRELTVETIWDGLPEETHLSPTTLSGGQRAVVRHTRAVRSGASGASGAADADEPHPFREMEWLRRVALATVGPTRTEAMFTQLLPVLVEAFDALVVLYYHNGDSSKRFARLGVASAGKMGDTPEEIKGRDYGDLKRAITADVTFLRVRDMTSENALPESFRTWLSGIGTEEVLLVPVRTHRERHGALVIARGAHPGALPGPQDQLLRALPEIIGTAIERNFVLRCIERGLSALLNK
ncbi:MAG: hypothetical protein IH969_00700 [Candidatus Krumholzibacteriota bacterium]|nr:hypothetical protein [Candidatus Krumholzibacteriota bacterium]